MKHVLTGLLLLLSVLSVSAQQDYFIFIQDAARRPFYVRMGEVSHSSSPTGHLILSRLRDSVYQLFVGFPREQYPEQLFTVAIARRDRGFELQQLGGEWRFFDLLSLQLIKPENAGTGYLSSTRRSDPYAQLMAGVVNDSAVLYATPPAAPAPAGKPVSSAEVKPLPAATAAGEITAGNNTAANAAAAQQGIVAAKQGSAAAGIPARVPANAAATETKAPAEAEAKVTPETQSVPVTQASSAIREPSVAKAPAEAKVPSGVKTLSETRTPAEAKALPATEALSEAKMPSVARAPAVASAPRPAAEPGKTGQPDLPAGLAAPAAPAAPYRDKRDIIRYGTENLSEGKLFIYLDRSGPATDTIRIIIPRL